jgi:hypothetical protein
MPARCKRGERILQRPRPRTAALLRDVLGVALVVAGMCVLGSDLAVADIAPASTAVTARSTDSQIGYSGTVISCTTADARGTTPVRGVSSMAQALSFGSGGRCTAFGLGATVSCSGRMLLRLTSFRSPSGSGTVDLDSDFNCTVRVTLAGCTITIQGPQRTVGPWDFTNTTQDEKQGGNGLAATDSGGTCTGNTAARTGRGIASLTATYVPNTRLTVS